MKLALMDPGCINGFTQPRNWSASNGTEALARFGLSWLSKKREKKSNIKIDFPLPIKLIFWSWSIDTCMIDKKKNYFVFTFCLLSSILPISNYGTKHHLIILNIP